MTLWLATGTFPFYLSLGRRRESRPPGLAVLLPLSFPSLLSVLHFFFLFIHLLFQLLLA